MINSHLDCLCLTLCKQMKGKQSGGAAIRVLSLCRGLSVLSELEGSCTALGRLRAACVEKMSHPESPFLKEGSIFWGETQDRSPEIQVLQLKLWCACFWSGTPADKSQGLKKKSCHTVWIHCSYFAQWIKFRVFTQASREGRHKRQAGRKWGRGLNNWGWNDRLTPCLHGGDGGGGDKEPAMRG